MDKEEREQEMSKIFGQQQKLPPVESIKVVTQEVLLEHSFRVWCLGRGRDYQVTLTTTGLILVPAKSSSSTVPPPLCCICPVSPVCLTTCCAGPRIEILGRDVVACRPAPNGGPFFPRGAMGRKKEKKMLKRMDPAIAGHPVFMLVAYPSKKKDGSRKKMSLYFHLPPKKEDGFSAQTTENPIEGKNSDGSRRQRQTAVAAKVRDTWVHAIETSLLPEIALPPYPTNPHAPPGYGAPKLLVIVNPFSGQKKAEKILTEDLIPFFNDAGMEYEVLITRYAGHAKEVIASERISDWRGIITISGDGLVHEVINGIFDRVDWREAFPRLPIGIIPGGSGNGLSRTLVHELGEPFDGTGLGSAILNVVRGRVKSSDLFYVESCHMEPRVGVLGFAYGIIADVDIESERLRYMGEARFTVYALQRIASLRTYRAKLWYLPASDYSELEKPRERSRPETIRKLEEELKAGNEEEETGSSSPGSSTESDYETTPAKVAEVDEVDEVDADDDDEVDADEDEDDSSSDSSASVNVNESLERDVPEITLAEESYNPGSVKVKSEQNNNQNNNLVETQSRAEDNTNEEITVLPSDYQFLFNRFSYSNLLTQGHLYFRSWDELQYRVLGSVTSGSNTLLSGVGSGPIMPRHPFERVVSTSDTESSCQQRQGPKFREMPPLNEPLPTFGATSETNSITSQDGSTKSFLDDWVYEEGQFVGINVVNIPYLSSNSFLAPKCRSDDGNLHLIILRGNMSKKNLLQLLIDMENGTHVNTPGVEIIPIRAFRFEPLGNPTQGAGIMTLDGEVIPTGPIQGHIMPSGAKLFVK